MIVWFLSIVFDDFTSFLVFCREKRVFGSNYLLSWPISLNQLLRWVYFVTFIKFYYFTLPYILILPVILLGRKGFGTTMQSQIIWCLYTGFLEGLILFLQMPLIELALVRLSWMKRERYFLQFYNCRCWLSFCHEVGEIASKSKPSMYVIGGA